MDAARLLEHVHGHVGCLAAAALTHPALVLRKRGRADAAVGSALGLVITAIVLGSLAYPLYRERIKQRLFVEAPAVGYLFERKEHLAFAVGVLALVGSAFYLSGRKGNARHQKLAQRAFGISAFGAWIVALLGIAVAITRTF